MKKRTYQTSINLLIEVALYQRLSTTAYQNKISMSKIIRDGTRRELDQIDKDNKNK